MNIRNLMQGLILPVFVFCLQIPAHSQQELKTTEVNIFKNGTYFVAKEGNILIDNYIARMELPPNPLLGTFWLSCSRDMNINKLVFITDTLKKNRPAHNFPDLMRANKGKKARLVYRLDDRNTGDITGTLQEVFVGSGLVKVKTSDGKTAYLPLSDIRQLFIDDNPVETIVGDSTAYMARIEFNRNTRDTRLKMVYMQTGIQWFPSYNIKILNEKELQIELRALVENFAEVIKDAHLTLTVGDPNYKFGQSVEQFTSPYLTAMGSQQIYNPFVAYQWQNTSAAAPMGNYSMIESKADEEYNDYQIITTSGDKAGDLYMYDLGKVTIPKNSKASFQIFSQKIPYRDVYKVSLQDVNNFYSSQVINNDPGRKFDVFHSLKLTNTTKDPFTTAPVFVMDEELRPLAQDEIRYAPLGTSVSVNLAKSPDIIVRNSEQEKTREERARNIDKHTYTRVVITGSIDVQNTLDKVVTLNADKSVTGNMVEVSEGGKMLNPPNRNGLNQLSRAEWEITLGKNEKKTITYTYEVYIMVN